MNQSSKFYINLEDVHVKVVESQENNLRQNEQSVVTLSILLDERNLTNWVNLSFAKLTSFIVFNLIVETLFEWLEYIFYQTSIVYES